MKSKIPFLVTAFFPALLLGPVQAGPVQTGPDDDRGYSYAAESEKLRRDALIIEAHEAYTRGQAEEQAGNLPQAGAEYRSALQLLPSSPVTEPYRKAYGRAFARVSTQLGQEAADGGNLRTANQYVSAALAADGDYEPAKILDKRLKDPEWYNPEYSQAHAKNVDEVTGRLRVAKSHQDIGRYEDADKEAEEILRIDPYNKAARRLMERGEHLRGSYREAAGDETRSRMLSAVAAKWEMPIPIKSLERTSIEDGEMVPGGGAEDVAARLKRTTIDIDLVNVSIKNAVERLRQKSAQSDPSGRGISFVLNEGGLDADAQTTPITVNLTNVPLEAALRYIVDLAGLVSRIDGNTVVISSAGDTTTLVRRTYRVPPYFINSGATSRGGGANDDPFADDAAADSGPRVVTAQQILEDNGIVFDQEGANARFNPQRGELVVTNTQQMLELVAAFVDTLDLDQPKQVTVTARFIEVRQENWQELGFDWYVAGADLNGGRLSASGGTYGDSPLGELEANTLQTPLANRFVPFNRQVTTPGLDGAPDSLDFVPFGQNPSTQSLRTGGFAVEGNAIDAILRGEGRGNDVSNPGPGILAMAGILTDPQFQVVLRGLNQKKGADLLTAPRVLTKSGQKATIEVVRELIYPSEYDPPELPQNVGSSGASGFPVTPANPTAFLTRNTGVTMEVLPVVAPDGFTMEVELSPEVIEFEGFVNYGSPIQTAGVNLLNQPINIVLTENRIDMPVFATRRAKTKVTVWDGATIAIGGLIREDVQHVQDKIPLLGDLPFVGRLFRSESDQHERRNLMIFVTAQLLDPGGSAIREGVGSGVGSGATSISSSVPTSGPQSDLLPPPEG